MNTTTIPHVAIIRHFNDAAFTACGESDTERRYRAMRVVNHVYGFQGVVAVWKAMEPKKRNALIAYTAEQTGRTIEQVETTIAAAAGQLAALCEDILNDHIVAVYRYASRTRKGVEHDTFINRHAEPLCHCEGAVYCEKCHHTTDALNHYRARIAA